MAKQKYYDKLFDDIKSNIKKTWQTINSILSRKCNKNKQCVRSLIVDGITLSDDVDIAEAFNNHFSTVGKRIDESLPNHSNQNNYRRYTAALRRSGSFFLAPITPSIISLIILRMKSKSTHIDTYSIRILKFVAEIIAPILCNIINQSFETGYFPKLCKLARVIPLFKAGD